MALGNIFRVTVHATFRNQASVNVLHYTQTSSIPTGAPATPTQLQAMSDAIDNTIFASFKACLSQDALYKGIVFRYLSPTDKNLDQQTQTTVHAGAGTAGAAGTEPSQVAGLIYKQTLTPNRTGRGRFYMPFVPRGAVDPTDLVIAAYKVLLQDLANDLATEVAWTNGAETGFLAPCVATMDEHGRPVSRRLITNCGIRDGFATQKRRGYFGRPNAAPI